MGGDRRHATLKAWHEGLGLGHAAEAGLLVKTPHGEDGRQIEMDGHQVFAASVPIADAMDIASLDSDHLAGTAICRAGRLQRCDLTGLWALSLLMAVQEKDFAAAPPAHYRHGTYGSRMIVDGTGLTGAPAEHQDLVEGAAIKLSARVSRGRKIEVGIQFAWSRL
jgi:hypothetical protein